MKTPNLTVEIFMSVVKWFLLFIVVNNLIWLLVVHSLVGGNGANISQTQDGEYNNQELVNG
ncbi:MAG: hypothetical protein J6S85_07225 [Methanobrevibacter sp.]|nr:hypothetical protein [Methanobrevibacter sp.]